MRDVAGGEIERVTSLSGGMIHAAAQVQTTRSTIFVKWNEAALPGMFETEARGLRAIAATHTLRVPEVRAVAPHFLALEYIAPYPPQNPARFAETFGAQLAQMHRESGSSFDAFGLDHDNYIGLLPQRNSPRTRWAEFYRDCRLLPQIEIARGKRRLPPARERLLMQLIERLDTLLEGLSSRPALLHGDLWSGNFLASGDTPVVLDPAIYYGEREMEIAYMELFGGFPAALFAAYRAHYPLEPGYEQRRPLHQIYPLLVHLNHFGETYGPDVEEAARRALNDAENPFARYPRDGVAQPE